MRPIQVLDALHRAMDLELVSFKTCPYVQRSRITMLHKGVDHDVTYIDLQDPPEWFRQKSPLGKVPILLVKDGDREEVLFESAVINEFVDEVSEGQLMPEDPIARAKTRAWIEFGSQCLVDFYQGSMAADEERHMQHVKALKDKLHRLEEQVVGPFFFGQEFTLADAALAPLIMRLGHFASLTPHFDLGEYPTLEAWHERLASLPEVRDSIVPEWKDLQTEYVQRNGGYLATLLA